MHFTYRKPKRRIELQQGDILRRTKRLDQLIRLVHPYYLKQDYTHFMVLTQSCDLVKRSDGYGAPYIAISAVRPLATVINREMKKYKYNVVLRRANAVGERSRERARFFLKNLLNNNKHEYFYLHEQVPGGLTDRSCVFLRLAVTFKIEHYDLIRQARILSLTPQFQAKLGWLVGNIYSRVGTEDWTPTKFKDDEWDRFIEDTLTEHIVILNDRKVDFVKKNHSEAVIESWNVEEARQRVLAAPEYKKRDEVIDITIDELVRGNILPAEAVTRARSQLRLSPLLKTKIGA